MITLEQINIWLTEPSENEHLEFKEAKRQYDNVKLFKYCIAIANEGGGYFIMGISDKHPRKVVGTAACSNLPEMATKIFTAVGFRVDIEEFFHPNGRVLIFHIPSRLKGTAYSYEGAYLMRVGSELRPMSEDKLRTIFAEGQPNYLDEPALDNLSGQDIIQLLDTQAFFELLTLPYPTNQEGVLEKLLSENLIIKNKSFYIITNLGAILLAKNLREFNSVYRKAARVVTYKDKSKLETIADISGEKGYAVGFKGLVRYVMSQIPQNEIIEGALRKESKLLPEIAIRELIANCLIHQDLSQTGVSPMIEIYKNRIEFSNPGKPIVPLNRFIDGYKSRNERMADLMRRFGICEEKSSGIDRVIETAEIHQLPAPEFTESNQRTSVIVFSHKPFKQMTTNDRVRACYQHCVLQFVLREKMTNQSLRSRFGLSDGSSNTASQIIATTIEQELIKPDPSTSMSKKYASYLPIWA